MTKLLKYALEKYMTISKSREVRFVCAHDLSVSHYSRGSVAELRVSVAGTPHILTDKKAENSGQN